jgi:FkbM family methyltransferase
MMGARVMNVFIHPRFDAVYAEWPLVLADVGARGGLRPNWREARRHLRLIGFEPDPIEYAALLERARANGSRDRYFGVALHNRKGTVDLYVARDRGLTSMFPPNRGFLDAFPDADRFDTVDRQTMATDTLDAVTEAGEVGGIDFIKADTQGSELFVLQGAERVLGASALGVEVEVEFAPIYTGQPLFADVDVYLRGLGFLLFDLRPCYWKRAAGRAIGGPHGEIIWADALYLRSHASLRALLARLETTRRKPTLLKAISIALLYGYVDYALELARGLNDVLPPDERTLLRTALESIGPQNPLPAFPGKKRLASALKRLSRTCQDRTDAWSVSEAELGNRD